MRCEQLAMYAGRRARWSASCVALALAACGETTAPPPAIDPIGWWGGSTAQREAILFRVDTLGVRQIELGYRIETPSCVSAGSLNFGGAPIENNEFTRSFGIGGNSFIVAGRFLSSNDASGTLTITHAGCAVTLETKWAANKLTSAPAAATLAPFPAMGEGDLHLPIGPAGMR